MKFLSTAALIAVIIISPLKAATSYSDMMHMLAEMDMLERLSGKSYISTVSIGRSAKGTHIPLVIIHDPEVPVQATAKLFIICRQHGNEPASTEAMISVIKSYFTQLKEQDINLLKKATILIVPMMNPDGSAKNQRRNANNADLNRDWLAMNQPETRAVAQAIKKWRPQIIIDAHELDADDYQGDFIESLGYSSGINSDLAAKSVDMRKLITQKLRTHGLVVASKSANNRISPRLAHRYYPLRRGTIALLVETRRTGQRASSYNERSKIHLITAMTAVRYLAGNAKEVRREIARWWEERSNLNLAARGGRERKKTK